MLLTEVKHKQAQLTFLIQLQVAVGRENVCHWLAQHGFLITANDIAVNAGQRQLPTSVS